MTGGPDRPCVHKLCGHVLEDECWPGCDVPGSPKQEPAGAVSAGHTSTVRDDGDRAHDEAAEVQAGWSRIHQVCGDPMCLEADDRKVCRSYLDRLATRVPPDEVAGELARVQAMKDAANPVTAAARGSLAAMQSDHAAAPLLRALAQRLCRDVDEAERVGERIAATRMVVELLRLLDGALFVASGPPRIDDDGVPDPDGENPDDPFAIGDVPPGVGDAPA